MATVRIPPILRPDAGNNRQVEVEGDTVREVLESLVATYPPLRERIFDERDELPQFLNVFIDGTDVRLNDGLETKVGAEATVILTLSDASGQEIFHTFKLTPAAPAGGQAENPPPEGKVPLPPEGKIAAPPEGKIPVGPPFVEEKKPFVPDPPFIPEEKRPVTGTKTEPPPRPPRRTTGR